MSVLGAHLSCRCEVERPANETRIFESGIGMWNCFACVLLGRVSRSMARRGLGTCHIIETLSVAWDAPCSPFRRFESDLNKTALASYTAGDLLPLSLEGARSRLGPLLTPLPGSKRRTCVLRVLLIVKAMNWLFCAGWTQWCSSMRHNQILSEQQDHEGSLPVQHGHVVSRTGRSPCEAVCHAAAAATSARPLFFHAGCHWRRSRDSDTGKQLDNVVHTHLQLDCCPWICPSFLLGKLRGVRNDRFGALFVLRDLINSSLQPRPAAIVDGVQHLLANVDHAVGVLLSDLILILGEAGFLTPTSHGEPPANGQPRRSVVRVDARAKEPS